MSAAVMTGRIAEASSRFKKRIAGLLYFTACPPQTYLTGENE